MNTKYCSIKDKPFGRTLEKDELIGFSKFLRFFVRDFSLCLQIVLVADEHYDRVGVGEIFGLQRNQKLINAIQYLETHISKPTAEMVKRRATRDIINQQSAGCTSII